ncbi:hypothetical protein BHF71_10825 [Vulcanibacillus modesticaldus]|uniref:YcxB-like C-terminal domain-containing protein n=1 Tax=Vulcanibacillus modesticaldus TaxID=337097 RepID=A0A1D2YSX7_9BACI|nr:YcxB family protein [Vulcanibacillus modesticaldus]OEF98812.1 hypothetical protein BHF71_10825 [Vulcanibacillus modesticaldus]
MVEARTRLDKHELLNLNKFHLFRKNVWLFLIPMFVFIVIGVLMIIFAEDNGDRIFGTIFLVVFGIGYPLISYIIMKLLVWFHLRSMKLVSNETLNYFKIDNEILFNRMEKTDMISIFEVRWNLVYKAYETQTHFFIYISNMQAFIIPKNGIFNGTSDELREMLKNSIGKKFKQYSK